MQVMVPEFIISTIAQSTPVSGIVNVISVTIEPSVELSGYDLSVIRITNLTGAEMPTNVVLSAVGGGNAGHELFCGTSGQTSLSIWNMTTSELILQLCENKSMAVGVQYTFEFSIMNPTQDQESPNIMIEARGRVVNIEFSPMTKSDAALLDVEGGASPLKVVVPLLTTKTIAQSTPIAGVINMISLTLSCNLQLRVPLSISVSGLSGASFGSSDATVVLDGYIANSLLCGEQSGVASWSISLCTGESIPSGSVLAVTFVVTNPLIEQIAPDITVTIQGDDFDIPSMIIEQPGDSLLGVLDGRNPMRVVIPTFSIRRLSQSSPLIAVTNKLTLDIQTNVDIRADESSVMSLSGFTVAGSTGAREISVTVSSPNEFGRTQILDYQLFCVSAFASGLLKLFAVFGIVLETISSHALSGQKSHGPHCVHA